MLENLSSRFDFVVGPHGDSTHRTALLLCGTWCLRWDLNPHTYTVPDFESGASADSTTQACNFETFGASDRNRTCTGLPLLIPKTRASTNSATLALLFPLCRVHHIAVLQRLESMAR